MRRSGVRSPSAPPSSLAFLRFFEPLGLRSPHLCPNSVRGRGRTAANELLHVASRCMRLRTAVAYQLPPRAVRTPRAFNADAIARKPSAPAASSCRQGGKRRIPPARSYTLRRAKIPRRQRSGHLASHPRTHEYRRARTASFAMARSSSAGPMRHDLFAGTPPESRHLQAQAVAPGGRQSRQGISPSSTVATCSSVASSP